MLNDLGCSFRTVCGRWDELTFILYGYSSLGDETPPERLTSRRHRRSVCNWLKIGRSASETGSDEIIKL